VTVTDNENKVPAGAVIITSSDMYKLLVELNGKVDKLLGISDHVSDLETRVRSLEKARWPLPALSLVVAIAAAVIGAFRLI
jgi:hypothetical protein